MLDAPQTAFPISALELMELAQLPASEIKDRVELLAERQSAAEVMAARQNARRMLKLLDHLIFYDEDAGSNLLRGVLHQAAGRKVGWVEMTSLRIAGLAEPGQETVVLTAAGKKLLSFLSDDEDPPQDDCFDTDTADESAAAKAGKDIEVGPFAIMRFGDQTFEIADGAKEGALVFRLQGEMDWSALDSDRDSGWDVIGAEMLSRSIDIFENYIKTHVIRMTDATQGEGVHVLELDQIRWWFRVSGEKAEISVDPAAGWSPIDDDIRHETVRALAIAAALRFIPDLRDRIAADVRSWVLRMAHAAAISPVMPTVS